MFPWNINDLYYSYSVYSFGGTLIFVHIGLNEHLNSVKFTSHFCTSHHNSKD